jgi:23S rRNA (adenine2030-N6)-methyltransferase
MLSYRHAFHAGNHADVLKHVVTIQLLRYLGQKDTPYMYIDTHAGAGVYALDSNYAAKNAEYETGISRLWDRKVEAHAAAQGQRPATRGKRVMIQKGDGFDGLKALLPPPSRRGLILIDPPYENKDDYRRVKDTLKDALSRFATGTYAVWYPVLHRMESRQLPEKLKQLEVNGWLNVTLSVSMPSPDGFGLHSSGMFVINPPWTLEPMLRELMPYLVKVLGTDASAGFVLESGDGPVINTGRRRV